MGSSPTGFKLWLRPIGALTAQPIAGSEGIIPYPFWSADSHFIAFFDGGKLKKVAVEGGPPQVLTDKAGPGAGTWNQDDVILFDAQGTIHRVSAAGGASTTIRTPDKSKNELAYSWPSFLPDGRHFLYVASNADPGRTEIRVGALDGGTDKSLFASNSRVLYAHPNHLLFVRDATLMAQPFDPQGLSLTGTAFPIAESVGSTVPGANAAFFGVAAFGVSTNGTLVYRVATEAAATELTWFDRSGKRLGVAPPNGVFFRPVFSPDQTRVVGERRDGNAGDIWIMDVKRGTSSRFTFDTADDSFAIFSPNGEQVAFASNRGGTFGVYLKPSTGVGAEQLLAKVPGVNLLGIADFSPDGRILLYNATNSATAYDTIALPLTGDDRKPYPILNQKYDEYRSRFSPDGRWLLYTSNETGRPEIYVQAFPPSGGKWQVSVNGGNFGYWRRDGREIVFDTPDRKIMAVDVKLGTTFEAGIPHELFELPAAISGLRLGMTADAQRFLVPLPAQRSGETAALRAVLNWPAEIKK
jgi:Tol biopolymer transport system component